VSGPVLHGQLLESMVVVSVAYVIVVAVVIAVLTVSSSELFHFDSPVRTDPVTAKHTANSSIR